MVEVNLVFPKSGVGEGERRVPLGLCYLSSAIKEAGYSVNCQDLDLERLNLNCKYLGVSVPTFCYSEALEIAQKAKEKGVVTVAGGIHASLDPRSLLEHGFDFCVQGDGERLLPDLLRRLEGGEQLDSCLHDRVDDVDNLPFPDFSWVDWGNYVQNTVPISTSRGCPYNCSFCYRPDRLCKLRSAGNIVKELALYEGKVVEVVDDVFTINRQRILELRDLLRKEGLDISFSLMNGVRVDSLDREVIRTLRRMRTDNINIGVESIHDDVLRLCNKGITFSQIKNVVKLLRKHGYKNNAAIYMIVGLPGDNLHKSLEAMRWVQGTGMKSSWCLATPFPGTEMYRWVDENARWLIDPRDYANYCGLYSRLKAMFETDGFTQQERLYAILKAKYEVERK